MPCLLLKGESLVKTVKFRNPSYIGDAINTVRIFNQKEVDELIFLDIEATKEKRLPQFKFLEKLTSECFMPFTYGGGVRRLEDIKTILNLGVEKVCLNTYAVENPHFVKEASDMFGSQSIIISIDVKKSVIGRYEVVTNCGMRPTKIDPLDFAIKMQQMGAGEILLTSIDRDGTWEGYDTDILKRVTQAVGIPVIACGGAGKIEDLEIAVKLGLASAVALGSRVVYQGKGMGVLINFFPRQELERFLN